MWQLYFLLWGEDYLLPWLFLPAPLPQLFLLSNYHQPTSVSATTGLTDYYPWYLGLSIAGEVFPLLHKEKKEKNPQRVPQGQAGWSWDFASAWRGGGQGSVALPAHSRDFQVLARDQSLEKGVLSPAQSGA